MGFFGFQDLRVSGLGVFFWGVSGVLGFQEKGFQGSVFFRGSVWGVQGYSNESPCKVCERPTISLDTFFQVFYHMYRLWHFRSRKPSHSQKNPREQAQEDCVGF